MSPTHAETLREAAAEIRRNAAMAEPGRWKMWGMQVMADPTGTSDVDKAVLVATPLTPSTAGRTLHTGNGLHMSGMDPVTARAVADLLDITADSFPDDADYAGPDAYAACIAALRLARVYLRTPCPRCSRRDHNDPGDNMCPDDNGAARCAID